MEDDFNEWRVEYPDGARILWHDHLIEKTWLPGRITGTRFWCGETVLLFRLDSDPPRSRLPHMLSIKNKKLLRKFHRVELEEGIVEKNWRSAEAYLHRQNKQ